MCANLTAQVRSIAGVTTAVAKVRRLCFPHTIPLMSEAHMSICSRQGDLTMTIDIEVEGEMATLKETVSRAPSSYLLAWS